MTQMTKRKSRKSRGTLALLGTFLVLSALFRLGTDAGQVIANEAFGSKADAEIVTEAVPLPASREQSRELLEALKAREATLEKRENEMNVRERTIDVAEQEIRQRLATLQEAEESLKATITLASTAAEDDLARLTDVYANMKPKQAAALFEQMDAMFAAGFLARMPAENAARLMAGLTPEKAYLISVELAGRNADIPLD